MDCAGGLIAPVFSRGWRSLGRCGLSFWAGRFFVIDFSSAFCYYFWLWKTYRFLIFFSSTLLPRTSSLVPWRSIKSIANCLWNPLRMVWRFGIVRLADLYFFRLQQDERLKKKSEGTYLHHSPPDHQPSFWFIWILRLECRAGRLRIHCC